MAPSEAQRAKAAALATQGEALPVELRTHDDRVAAGTLRRQILDAATRGRRARTWLVTFLALAPVTVVIPPHLPWLLTMIAVGIGGYIVRGRSTEVILGGEGHCPACGAWQLLDGGSPEFPMAHFCTECRARSLVSLVAPRG